MDDELLEYSDLWTSGRYALVDDSGVSLIFDLRAHAPLVIEIDEAVYSRLVGRMREAGVPQIGPDDVKPR